MWVNEEDRDNDRTDDPPRDVGEEGGEDVLVARDDGDDGDDVLMGDVLVGDILVLIIDNTDQSREAVFVTVVVTVIIAPPIEASVAFVSLSLSFVSIPTQL